MNIDQLTNLTSKIAKYILENEDMLSNDKLEAYGDVLEWIKEEQEVFDDPRYCVLGSDDDNAYSMEDPLT